MKRVAGKKNFFSIVVPVKKISNYILTEIIPALIGQSYKNFELIIVPDRHQGSPVNGRTSPPSFVKIFPSWPETGPAQKRDLGVKKSQGEIVVFLDDDAYPSKDWLKKALKYFKNQKISAVCGPGITPENDPLLAKVSGWMWASRLGSGGAGIYRCWPEKKRYVDDFPTFNLMVRKKDFWAVGGFDTNFWPGEDTKLCHDLVYCLKKKIIYDPEVLVYHHRRKIFKDHLKQLGRYGFHRGHFVKILPKTSRRIGYFLPLMFFLGIFLTPVFYFLIKLAGFSIIAEFLLIAYLSVLSTYLGLLLLTGFWVWFKSKNLLTSVLVMPTIFISHLFYGWMFLKGIVKKEFKSKYGRESI